DVDSVCVLWGLFRFLVTIRQNRRRDRLPAVDGGRVARHGAWGFSICAGRDGSVVPIISRSVDRARGGDHLPSGGGQSLRHGVGETRDRLEPVESDTGV